MGSKKKVKIEDLPKPEEQLDPKQQKAVKGGFRPSGPGSGGKTQTMTKDGAIIYDPQPKTTTTSGGMD